MRSNDLMIQFTQPTIVSNRPETSQSQVSCILAYAVREQRNNFNCIKNKKINKKTRIDYKQLGGY